MHVGQGARELGMAHQSTRVRIQALESPSVGCSFMITGKNRTRNERVALEFERNSWLVPAIGAIFRDVVTCKKR
jgi:hypothetical protein